MASLERLLLPLVLTAVAAYVSPGLAAFCGAALLKHSARAVDARQ